MIKRVRNIAIIICHYGDPSITHRCLRSIPFSQNSNQKIYLIDNSQNYIHDSSIEHDVVIQKTVNNIGYGAASNLGVKLAVEDGYEHFLICNNDLVFEKMFFETLFSECFSSEYVVIAPIIRYLTSKDEIWYKGGYIDKYRILGRHIKKTSNIEEQELIPVDFISGCIFYITKKVIDKVGLFDERYFLYDEDLDFSIRLKENEISITCLPDLIAYHDVSKNSGGNHRIGTFSNEIYFHRIRSRYYITKTYGKNFYAITASLYLLILYIKYSIIFLLRREYKLLVKFLFLKRIR